MLSPELFERTLPLRDLDGETPCLLQGRHASCSKPTSGHDVQGFRAEVSVSPSLCFVFQCACVSGSSQVVVVGQDRFDHMFGSRCTQKSVCAFTEGRPIVKGCQHERLHLQIQDEVQLRLRWRCNTVQGSARLTQHPRLTSTSFQKRRWCRRQSCRCITTMRVARKRTSTSFRRGRRMRSLRNTACCPS